MQVYSSSLSEISVRFIPAVAIPRIRQLVPTILTKGTKINWPRISPEWPRTTMFDQKKHWRQVANEANKWVITVIGFATTRVGSTLVKGI